MPHRIFRSDTQKKSLADADQQGRQGDGPFPPDDLPEQKGLEEAKAFLGGDVPSEAQNHMFGTDPGGAVGRTGLAVQALVDRVLDPLAYQEIAGDDFFRQFVFSTGDIQFVSHLLEHRTDAAAFAALHAFLKFTGSL